MSAFGIGGKTTSRGVSVSGIKTQPFGGSQTLSMCDSQEIFHKTVNKTVTGL